MQLVIIFYSDRTSNFWNQMYKKKEEKLTEAKINQSLNDMKQDLLEYISYENQRANVDNAKKRAVAQRNKII